MIKVFSRITSVARIANCLCALTVVGSAADLAKPKGEIILVMSGAITNINSTGKAEFDMDMVKALPVSTFKTSTTWTKGVKSFTGVSLKALLAAVGATGKNLHSIAINDYAVEIPATDAVDDGPILAYSMDDQPMSVRDKGPLWMVYPYDAKLSYRTEEIYSRSIWQLSKIDVQN
jgi:hypothetical protein